MDTLAETVLSLIRTDQELTGAAASSHGLRMNQAVDLLEEWSTADVLAKYLAATEALNEAVDVQARSNDLDGPIGRAVVRLMRLHPQLAVAAQITPGALVDWMIIFQFYARHRCGFFNPADYLPALGAEGVSLYEDSLREVEQMLPPRPGLGGPDELATLIDWQTLDRQRMYVAELQLRISSEPVIQVSHQQCAYDAARRWWLLACEFHPAEIAAARLAMFRLRPNCDEATALYEAASAQQWESYRFEVLAALENSTPDVVRFVFEALQDVAYAWDLAHLLGLDLDDSLWEPLTAAYSQHRRSV